MEFFGGFDEGVEFAFAGFLGGHVVADLDQLLDLCAFAGNEVYLFIVACAVIEQCFTRNIATAQQFYKHLILQQSAEVFTEVESRASHKAVVNHIHFLGALVINFSLLLKRGK